MTVHLPDRDRDDCIQVDLSDRVSTMRIDRPDKKNALTASMYGALASALREGDRSNAVGVHLILGYPGAFTAGNDLNEFLAVAKGGTHDTRVLDFLTSLATAEKPIVAGVDGLAIGVGTTLLFHCDLVYATPGSMFKTPFLDLGLVPEAGSSLLAPARMGHQRAFELLCLGELFDGERAREAGFVNTLVPAADLEDVALSAARRLADKPPQALAEARRLIRGDPAATLARIEEERALFSRRLKSDEARMAFEAFLGGQ